MIDRRPAVRLGPYFVVRVTGAGGMGRTELAFRADAPDAEIAVLRRLPAGDPTLHARAELATRLAHENIGRTLHVEEIDGQLYLMHELVDGVTLGKVMRQLGAWPAPAPVALYVARELARALDHAHRFGDGVIHGDLTPENVMLSFGGDVKLINFGTARPAVTAPAPADTGVVFTHRAYVPPEAADGAPLDRGTDLYALGVLLWELLTGHRAEDLSDHSIPHPAAFDPGLPASLNAVVARALEPAPEQRYQTADELRAALDDLALEGEDPREALRAVLTRCFDVELVRDLLAEEIAEARERLPPPEEAVTVPAGTPVSRPIVPTVPLLPHRRRGLLIAGGVAATVAVGGIAALRHHDRVVAAAPTMAVAPAPPDPRDRPVARALAAVGEPPADLPAPFTPAGQRHVSGRNREPIARVTRPWSRADQLLGQANDLWERGDTTGALDRTRQALAAGAGAKAHVLLGLLLVNMQSYDAAEPELLEAVRLEPSNTEAQRLLALLRRTAAEGPDK